MNKSLLLLVLMGVSVVANAQWQLQQSRDGNWITNTTSGNQLIVGNGRNGTHFLLALNINADQPPLLAEAYLTVDRFEPEAVQLQLLEKRPTNRLYRIDMPPVLQNRLVNRMIAGLAIRFGYANENNIQNFLQFSLLGFTAAWKELQAVNQEAPLAGGQPGG